jgi:1-acyl-sn-glycerol-3-phosphate acyltransferase
MLAGSSRPSPAADEAARSLREPSPGETAKGAGSTPAETAPGAATPGSTSFPRPPTLRDDAAGVPSAGEGERPPAPAPANLRGRDAPEALRRESPRMRRLFARILARRFRGAFHALRLSGEAPALPREARVVVCANHPSWWDPITFALLAAALFPGRRPFGPIEAAMLRRYGFMGRIGAFGVEPGPRGARAFLGTSSAILAEPARMVWVTAEGAFADPRRRPLALRPGVARLMARERGLTLLPLAVEYPFWSESRPEALARFGPPLTGEDDAPGWSARIDRALTETLDALAGDAVTREPARFRTLETGSTGVGGVYDLWRRARAVWRGERFEPRHMPDEERP